MKHLLLVTICVGFLIGFNACEKANSTDGIEAHKSKDINATDANNKILKKETLVALVLTDQKSLTAEKIKTVDDFIKQGLAVEQLKSSYGKLTYFDWDNSKGFYEVENLKQPALTLADLNIDVEATSLSHLTTCQNTPVEVVTYEPDAALLRVVHRGIAIVVISTAGRNPENLQY